MFLSQFVLMCFELSTCSNVHVCKKKNCIQTFWYILFLSVWSHTFCTSLQCTATCTCIQYNPFHFLNENQIDHMILNLLTNIMPSASTKELKCRNDASINLGSKKKKSRVRITVS